jgi:NADH dehydrogenase
MTDSKLMAVTGAFSYTGKYIAARLLERGHQVITITGHPDHPDPFAGQVAAHPLAFDDPDSLSRSLQGASTLINTYWVRFCKGRTTFARAVANTGVLIDAAERAGVERIVHVSITNPSADSPLPYFNGKAQVEARIKSSRLSWAILRPTVVFGSEDILINNIAYLLRRYPVFAVPGNGGYRLQPIFAGDLAELAADAADSSESFVADAAGPETFTFDELVRLIAANIGRRSRIIHTPPLLALTAAKLLGLLVGDVVLTSDEVRGLMADLLISSEPAAGRTRLSEWLQANVATVGSRYASELERHYR